MARKSQDVYDDPPVDEDTVHEAEPEAEPPVDEPPPQPEPEPEKPPLERLRDLLIALHHQAQHNAPVSTGIINELRDIADKLDPEHAEAAEASHE
jgi:hypothetical protein